MLNLKHLYYYHIYSQELSTTEAAKRLSISAPALSNQLKELEGFLGFQLTTRFNGKVAITEHGKMVAHYADRMFAAYDELKSRVSSDKKVGTVFRIGISDNLGVQFSFDLLSLVVKSQLSITAETFICFDGAAKILARFKEGEFDLILGAFVLDAGEETNWISQKLTFPVRLFAPPNLITALRADGQLPEALALDWVVEVANNINVATVLPADGSTLRQQTDLFFLNLKVQPERTIECNNSNAIVQLIERGFAMGFVPTPCLLDFKSAQLLSVLGPPGGYWNHEVSVLARKDGESALTNISPLAEIFSPNISLT